YVAVPYQVFEITHSSFVVGMLGAAQLVPLLLFALWGGAYADAMDRRRLLIISELLMTGGSLALVVNSLLPAPNVWVIFAASAAIRRMPPADQAARPGIHSIVEGLKYARSRPELIGTYAVDMVAMTFAMPMALFPAMAVNWGGAPAAGCLYSAMSFGSLFTTLFSGWTTKVVRHGAAVVVAAAIWGLAIVALGFAPTLGGAVFCLALAGAADSVSGVFRGTIWNETIPSELRGRLAGVEMISYLSGPLLGNARAGWVATISSNTVSVVTGGLTCFVAVILCIPLLPTFWKYRAERDAEKPEFPLKTTVP